MSSNWVFQRLSLTPSGSGPYQLSPSMKRAWVVDGVVVDVGLHCFGYAGLCGGVFVAPVADHEDVRPGGGSGRGECGE